MLITNHVLAGAVIGAVAHGPASAFIAGVASHFVMDSIPHWGDDAIFLRVAVVDGLAGLTAMGVVLRRTDRARRGRVLAGMLGACAPDSDKPGRLFLGRSPLPRALDAFHYRLQREYTAGLPQEVVVAAALSAVVRRVLG